MNPIDFNSPTVSFRPNLQKYLLENFINPKLDNFWQVRGINVSNAIFVKSKFSITDLNFKTIDVGYFYNRLFKQIKKDKIFELFFYTITHDEKLVTLECSDTGLKYNEILLGKKPIFYFVYFDLQEIFNFIRTNAKSERDKTKMKY